MEVALTVGIGEGKSAKSLSRDIRKYLNDPDLMFRRFKYKIAEKEILDEDGNVVGTEKIYGRKWKKRSVDSKGRVTWDDCDPKTYETGSGVYKSAYKNAMRVARTETNMAYRHADNERWGNLDFVLGQEIELSRNHPKEDICDELAGKYPKDFVFSGWHPQCFCHATAITASAEEMKKWIEARNAGEEYEFEGKVTDVPEGFRRWIGENEDKIHQARMRGKEPYFLKENKEWVDRVMNGEKDIMEEENIHILSEVHNKKEAIKFLKRQKKEYMYALDEKGRVIEAIEGDVGDVKFNDDVLEKLKDKEVIHNHPMGLMFPKDDFRRTGHSLSGDDMKTAADADVKSLSAYSPLYEYKVMRPKEGWGCSGDDMYRNYNKIYRQIKQQYAHYVDKPFEFIFQHLAMKRLAEEKGFVYIKTRRNK